MKIRQAITHQLTNYVFRRKGFICGLEWRVLVTKRLPCNHKAEINSSRVVPHSNRRLHPNQNDLLEGCSVSDVLLPASCSKETSWGSEPVTLLVAFLEHKWTSCVIDRGAEKVARSRIQPVSTHLYDRCGEQEAQAKQSPPHRRPFEKS